MLCGRPGDCPLGTVARAAMTRRRLGTAWQARQVQLAEPAQSPEGYLIAWGKLMILQCLMTMRL